MTLIERNRRALDRNPRLRRFASPALFGLERTILKRLRANAVGDVLDLGCGDMPYRSAIIDQVATYDGLDITPRNESVRYVTSVEDMTPVPDSCYDTVICTELLEHVEDPRHVAAEIHRVLRPGGRLVLSVPFLGRLHEEPRDFYRYTRHGLRTIFGECGFVIDEVVETGSVFSFVGHQFSTAAIGTTWHLPVIRWITFVANAVVIVGPAVLLDAIAPPMRRKLPLGYVMVAWRAQS